MSTCSDLMRKLPVALVAASLATASFALYAATGAAGKAAPRFGFGKPATPAEIAGWDIDVRPDGTGLPPGKGSVAMGQDVYDAQCASCHGTFGESNDYMVLAGGIGSLATNEPVRTLGSKLNHATRCGITSIARCRSTRRRRSPPTRCTRSPPTCCT